MKDTLNKFILNDCVRITACKTTGLVEYARNVHNTMPTATAALGRVLTAAVLMGSDIKTGNMTLSINGGGIAGTILATADDKTVKGYIANASADLPPRQEGKLDVSGIVGKDGFITVVKDLGFGEPYVGKCEIECGEIAEDVAYYYLKSEQQPGIVYLSVWVETDGSVLTAGGLTILPLPGAKDDVLTEIEERLFDINNYGISIFANSAKQATENIFKGMNLKVLSETNPEYKCDCSEERLSGVIISLGKKEIESIIEEDGKAEIVCRFCGKKYNFDKARLQSLLKEALDG